MTVYLDGLAMHTPQDTHVYLAKKFSAPAYYGNNLDALYELLTELCQPTQVRVGNAQDAALQLGDYADRLWRVLRDAAAENPMLTVVF